MKYWPIGEERGYSPLLVQEHCVRNTLWQSLRLAMKGKSTEVKLDMCLDWYRQHGMTQTADEEKGTITFNVKDVPFAQRVQVANYLGALRRGGQLDLDNKVQR